jgi:hypothetical protein
MPQLWKNYVLLTPIQIDNFITYRTLLGRFLTIYEIQAIPSWDLATIQKIRLYYGKPGRKLI